MEIKHTKINQNDGKLEINWDKSKNTEFLEKYRPFLTIFLKKSVLQTKIIFTDQIVITACPQSGRCRSFHCICDNVGETRSTSF